MRRRRGPTSKAVRRFPAQLAPGWLALAWALPLFLAAAPPAPAQFGLRVSPLSIDFGSRTIGGPGADGPVQIQNTTTGTVVITLVLTVGSDPEDFIPRNNCMRGLAPGTSCSVNVVFSPTQPGQRSAALQIFIDGGASIMVGLSGSGTTGSALPTITCPASVSVTAAAGQTAASVAIGMATATGDGVKVTGTRGDGGALGAPYPVGVTIVTWTATDRAFNTATCAQAITVQAVVQSLSIRCPPDQAVAADGANRSAAVLPGLATSTSPGARIIGVRSDGRALSELYPVGTTTITWTATDAAGDEGTCAQTITVGSVSSPPSPSTGLIDPSSANPWLDGLAPAQGPLYQGAILHGSGFADFQGSSYVLVGGRRVTVLAWSASAINLLMNPLAFDPAPLALNAAYPVQVITPDSGGQSNTVSFFLTDGAPTGPSTPGVKNPSAKPRFTAFQQALFCPGDTVVFLGANFGPAQGAGYVEVTLPLGDPTGNVVQQAFVLPVLAWADGAISFILNLPAGAIPGSYLATLHRSDGKTASGRFTVGAPRANGDCAPIP